VGERAAGHQHLPHGGGDEVAVGPVEGVAERHDPEFAKAGRQVFGTGANPAHVRHPAVKSPPLGLRQHVFIRVDADRLAEERGQGECQDARPAAHIEQPALSVQAEGGGQRFGEAGGIRKPSALVIGRSSLEQGAVPPPSRNQRIPAPVCPNKTIDHRAQRWIERLTFLGL